MQMQYGRGGQPAAHMPQLAQATSVYGRDRQHSCREGREQKIEQEIRKEAQAGKQKADQQIWQRKEIEVAQGEDVGLICGKPPKTLGHYCSKGNEEGST